MGNLGCAALSPGVGGFLSQAYLLLFFWPLSLGAILSWVGGGSGVFYPPSPAEDPALVLEVRRQGTVTGVSVPWVFACSRK